MLLCHPFCCNVEQESQIGNKSDRTTWTDMATRAGLWQPGAQGWTIFGGPLCSAMIVKQKKTIDCVKSNWSEEAQLSIEALLSSSSWQPCHIEAPSHRWLTWLKFYLFIILKFFPRAKGPLYPEVSIYIAKSGTRHMWKTKALFSDKCGGPPKCWGPRLLPTQPNG
jgi:hypothetical protein